LILIKSARLFFFPFIAYYSDIVFVILIIRPIRNKPPIVN